MHYKFGYYNSIKFLFYRYKKNYFFAILKCHLISHYIFYSLVAKDLLF